MEIRDRKTGQLMTLDEFRTLQKQISTPYWHTISESNVEEFDADIIFEGPQAEGGTVYQHSMRVGIEQKSDGKWYTKYILGPIFQDIINDDGSTTTALEQEIAYKRMKDEQQSNIIRMQRNKLLAECDWTQLKDTTQQISETWVSYRQALRDIPLQSEFPWTIAWPVKPE